MNARRTVVGRAVAECQRHRRIAVVGPVAEDIKQHLNGVHEIVQSPDAAADVLFLDVDELSPNGRLGGRAQTRSATVVGLTLAPLEELGALFVGGATGGVQLRRLISPAAVFEFTAQGCVLVEVAHPHSGREVGEAIGVPLLAGPDLKALA